MEGHTSTGGYVANLDAVHGDLRFTDDTAMTIGVAESLLDSGGFDGHQMAQTFARHYADEPWRGYGASPPEVFGRIDQGVPWDEAARSLFGGTGSFGNGAAMRVAPVALFAHPDTRVVAAMARETAVITHTHPEGVDGAVAQAVAVDRVLALDPDAPIDPLELIDRIRGHVTTAIFRDKLAYLSSSVGQRSVPELAQVLGSGVAAHASVPTALACFLTHPRSFPEAVKAAISLGGDTDTVAAMTGALAGALGGLAAIPPRWRSVEGYDTLKQLADQLLSR